MGLLAFTVPVAQADPVVGRLSDTTPFDAGISYYGVRTTNLSVNINAGPGLAGNAAALAAFQRAAQTWSHLLSDPISVNIDADLTNLGNPNVIGQTGSVLLQAGYDTIRNAMVADAALDGPSNAIVASLPTSSQITVWRPAGFSVSGNIVATKANLKALGFAGLDATFGNADATMDFNSSFAFDYDNSDGVSPGMMDFESVALHEIGHALGFVSGVDDVDYLRGQGQSGTVSLYALDLFRFRNGELPTTAAEFTSNTRSLLANDANSFADTVNTYAMSTGAFTGDGYQASHWKADELSGHYIGLMDPSLAFGQINPITAADLRAFDLIGYTVVPEPSSFVLMGLGLVGTAAVARRRRKAA